MKFQKCFLFFLFILIALIGCSNQDCLIGKVTKIVDGDTVYVQLTNGTKIKVRIWNIDTPEKYYTKKLYKDARRCNIAPKTLHLLGKLASDMGSQILPVNATIILKQYGKGYYGRTLGEIFINGTQNYGLLMVEKGYACVYNKTDTSSIYFKAMVKAKLHKKGLWHNYYKILECLCK